MGKIFGFAALMAGTALAMPTHSWAQDAVTGDENASNEIIVTATRDARSLQNVPMSVNVATGEQLQKLSIFDAKDVQQLAPGLDMTNTTGRNNTTTLRGISFDPDQGTSPAVQVYYNEIPTDAQTAYTAVYDIQQIEVLRGPQGLLRGLSAPAGSITIATRRPSFEAIEGYMQGTATDRAGYNVQGAVSLPFSDKVALRVAGLVDGNRVNNVRNVNRGNDRSYGRTESVRATLGFRPGEDFTAYLTYQYLHADNTQYQQVVGSGNTPYYQLLPLLGGFALPNGDYSSGPALGASDYRAAGEGVFRNQNETHLVNLAADWDLGAATLSFVGAHQYSLLKINRDLDPGNAVPDYVAASAVRIPYKVDTAELRLSSNNKDGLGWGVGAFYTRQTGTTRVQQPGDAFFFPVAPAESQAILGALPYLPIDTIVTVPVDTTTWSFNGNLRFRSGPLSIEGGLRYTIIKANQTSQLTLSSPGNVLACPNFGCSAFAVGPTEIIPAALQRRTYKPVTGGANISYQIMPTLNVFAAYGHSYRAGSTGVGVPGGVTEDLIQTRPEKTDSFELGVKGSFADRRFNYALSAYYQKLDNYLSRFAGIYYESFVSAPPTGFYDFNYNGDATIKGIEASLDGRITRNWDFGISAAYTKARYKNALVPCNDFDGSGAPNQNGQPAVSGTGNVSYCVSNDRLADVPDFSLTANTEIRIPMGAVTPFVRALFTYRPGFYSQRVDYRYQDRELLNLFAGFRTQDQRFELTVFVKNMLNQKRITNIALGNATYATATAQLSLDSGYRLASVTNPREFGLSGTFRF
ncbi:TonB-dependent receptor [Sphingomonas bisphenolicum]|uniref:TonB-dependent receptor n=1 Tax=Sphingomonas bisphenolicum TaxID=296544 RepID=A0ABN5WCT6_9SPHN|nr:TonB-dependent receptor [Sphingomonas bisphenolicum]BBF69678.1 TonB-dependent receptor [Sphingomonas bisphenolicum]